MNLRFIFGGFKKRSTYGKTWRRGLNVKHKITKRDLEILDTRDENLTDGELDRKMELEDVFEREEKDEQKDRNEGNAGSGEEPIED